MELDKRTVLDELMKIPSENTTTLFISISILQKYVPLRLINDGDNNIKYVGDVEDLLKSDVTNGELLQIRNGGWEYSEDKKQIVRIL